MKPKVGLAPARVKQEREKKAAEAKAGLKATAAGAVVATGVAGYEETERSESGHGPDTSESMESAEALETYDEESQHDRAEVFNEVLHNEPEELHDESQAVYGSEEELQEADISVGLSTASEESSASAGYEHDKAKSVPAPLVDLSNLHHTPDVSNHERINEVKPRVHGNDIEDMVNLLESGGSFSKSSPKSVASIPDEDVDEIPDEE